MDVKLYFPTSSFLCFFSGLYSSSSAPPYILMKWCNLVMQNCNSWVVLRSWKHDDTMKNSVSLASWSIVPFPQCCGGLSSLQYSQFLVVIPLWHLKIKFYKWDGDKIFQKKIMHLIEKNCGTPIEVKLSCSISNF